MYKLRLIISKVTSILYHGKFAVFVAGYSLSSFLFICSLYFIPQSGIYFLNVGQGDSIFLNLENGNRILIDAGNVDGRSVEEIRKILPWYNRRIDLAIGTHADIDHVGGFTKIVKNFSVGKFLFSHLHTSKQVEKNLFDSIYNSNISTSTINRGAKISFEGSTDHIDILYPARSMHVTSDKDTNLFSIVAMVNVQNKKYLLTGDAPRSVELKLVTINDDLKSDVLKVGHHGSRTSTDPIFLEKVSPNYAIISAGKNNRYGHPHAETIENLKKENAKILKTSEMGTIKF